jgi:hypothetical protein
MTSGMKGALWLLAVLVVIFVGFRIVRPREGTRSVSVPTSARVLTDSKLRTQLATSSSKTRCKKPSGPLAALGVRGPSKVIVRESVAGGASLRFSVNCDTGKVASLGL